MALSEPTVNDLGGVYANRVISSTGVISAPTNNTGNLVRLKVLTRVNQSRGKVPGSTLWKDGSFGLIKQEVNGLYGRITYDPDTGSGYIKDGFLSNYFGSVRAPTSPDSVIQTRLKFRAEDSLRQSVTKIPLGELLSEFKESEAMVVDFCKSAWGALEKIRKGRGVRHMSTKDVANMHLAMEYGVKPLASDLYKGVTALLADPPPKIVCFKGGAEDSFSGDLSTGSNLVRRTNWTGRTAVRARCYARVENPALALGTSLGLTNPLLLVWNKAHASFVVDWILPVSSTLRCVGAFQGYQFLTGSWSLLHESSGTHSIYGVKGGYAGSASERFVQKNISRSAYNAFPASLPPLMPNFTPKKAINAIALLRQNIRLNF